MNENVKSSYVPFEKQNNDKPKEKDEKKKNKKMFIERNDFFFCSHLVVERMLFCVSYH